MNDQCEIITKLDCATFSQNNLTNFRKSGESSYPRPSQNPNQYHQILLLSVPTCRYAAGTLQVSFPGSLVHNLSVSATPPFSDFSSKIFIDEYATGKFYLQNQILEPNFPNFKFHLIFLGFLYVLDC